MLGDVRDFVRAELPFVPAAGDRLSALITRSSPMFAVLAGIGAGRIAGDVLAATTGVVADVMRPEAWPFPYQVREVAAPAVALIVARRAGGPRAAMAYIGFAGLVVVLRWGAHAISCARIERELLVRIVHCDLGILERLGGIAPLLVGLAVGLLVARAIAGARRVGSNAFLEAAGTYTAVPSVLALGGQAFAYEPSQVAPGLVAYVVGTTVAAGLLAGGTLARRSATPVRTALAFAILLLATWLYPLGWSQTDMAMRADWPDRPELLLFATPLLGIALVIVGAAVTRRHA